MQDFTLTNGVTIPAIGFGSYKITGQDAKSILKQAIASGYRHIDTASFYQNENEIRRAIDETGFARKELFLTSKVWKDEMGYEETLQAFSNSTRRLGTNYLDAYLIHWPRPDLERKDWRELLLSTWRALEDLYHEGNIRAIGVSNFVVEHLSLLMENARIAPMLNQIEYHPGYLQEETVSFCKAHNIQVEAWAPLGRGNIFYHPTIADIAANHHKTPAQVCLRFCLQNGIVALPKASSVERMLENQDLCHFALSKEEMQAISSMPRCGWTGLHPDHPRELNP